MEKEEILREIYHCVKCKLCSISSFHPSKEWLPLCPSGQFYGYQAFYAPGKLEIFREILEGKISEPTEGLLRAAYACTLCGACYEKCKQVTSVKINLSELFEELRKELVKKGWILGAHKKIAEKIKDTHNAYGEKPESRPLSVKNADLLYFIGCTSRYRELEIAESMMGIFDKLNIKYQILDEEWCCGSVLLRTGQVEEMKELMDHNIEEIKKSSAKTIVFTCPGCLMTFEKNYPDLGLKLVHSTQFLSRLGNIKLKKLSMNVAYHDPCHLGRELGIYEDPRKILKEVADVKEMRRERELAWCCGSGGGVKSAFDDFALWSARDRIKEAKGVGAEALVGACPFCKRNLREAVENGMKVFDVVELVNWSLEGK